MFYGDQSSDDEDLHFVGVSASTPKPRSSGKKKKHAATATLPATPKAGVALSSPDATTAVPSKASRAKAKAKGTNASAYTPPTSVPSKASRGKTKRAADAPPGAINPGVAAASPPSSSPSAAAAAAAGPGPSAPSPSKSSRNKSAKKPASTAAVAAAVAAAGAAAASARLTSAGVVPGQENGGEDRRSESKGGRDGAGAGDDGLPAAVAENGSTGGDASDALGAGVDGDIDGNGYGAGAGAGAGGADASGGCDAKRGRKRRRREHGKDEETGETAEGGDAEEGRGDVGGDAEKRIDDNESGAEGGAEGNVREKDGINASAGDEGADLRGGGEKNRGRKRGRTGASDNGDGTDAIAEDDAEVGPVIEAVATGGAGVRRGSRVKKSIAYLGDSAGDDEKVCFTWWSWSGIWVCNSCRNMCILKDSPSIQANVGKS